MNFNERVKTEKAKHTALIEKKNSAKTEYNGIFTKYENPVLTRDHTPLEWRYDFDEKDNPLFIERLGINAVMNSGAIFFEGKWVLVPRIEGKDRKSFFGVARSDNGIDNFVFDDYPILFDRIGDETNLYDMRLTLHEDGWIYGIFCAESLDPESNNFEAVAAAGIVRTKDMKTFERLPNLKTVSPQQRNCVLHPEFVNGKYMIYTRPQDGFIDVGGAGGISYGFCDSMEHAEIPEEKVLAPRRYHTVYETKNGGGCVPVKTDKGWIHVVHGVRNTADGLRYVVYAIATDLNDPTKLIAEPSGYLIAPLAEERTGDVSNVVFANGGILKDDTYYLYYAASDTRLHVATFELDRLIDYVFNTGKDPLDTHNCVKQRIALIEKNMKLR